MTDFLYKTVEEAIKAGLLSGKVGPTRYERVNVSENGTEVPPAYLITDSEGGMWSLGNEYAYKKDGYLEFNVIRNNVDMDVVAEKIVYKDGRVWIFGSDGWKHWSKSRRHFI